MNCAEICRVVVYKFYVSPPLLSRSRSAAVPATCASLAAASSSPTSACRPSAGRSTPTGPCWRSTRTDRRKSTCSSFPPAASATRSRGQDSVSERERKTNKPILVMHTSQEFCDSDRAAALAVLYFLLFFFFKLIDAHLVLIFTSFTLIFVPFVLFFFVWLRVKTWKTWFSGESSPTRWHHYRTKPSLPRHTLYDIAIFITLFFLTLTFPASPFHDSVRGENVEEDYFDSSSSRSSNPAPSPTSSVGMASFVDEVVSARRPPRRSSFAEDGE